MKNLDQEWLSLIEESKKLGITIEEIRAFLNIEKEKDVNES
ncbi:hypothetical protein J8TS2_27970 [Lederbergia ruris]|uniref:Sin domain-containing protein n=1 Tax=Lederbergia ruris TaxID=217495 RepID=A0ABQ4KKJ5_9BACI|nr:DNA-binding anti-repressor SinI [Lederbergia ruris]GIN58478.1 hypothetical protein J8TS2_27970 [Lederbergia ruris]